MWYKWQSFGINIHFVAFTGYPLFTAKQTFARIDFLRQDERLVDRKGTFSVKFLAEKITVIGELTSGQVNKKASG